MSTQPIGEHEVLLDAYGNPIETWGGKFERKFKENPFVPVRTCYLYFFVSNDRLMHGCQSLD